MSNAEPHRSLLQNLSRSHGFEPLVVEGTLPEGLAGTLYRCGPGVFERFGRRLPHPFFADGVMSAVRFDGRGGASGAARVIESEGYRAEEAAGRYLSGPGASFARRVRSSLSGRIKNTGNTRAWTSRGRVFAILENCRPTEMNPMDLSWKGESDLDGAVLTSFSAHPHRVAARATTYNFGLRYGKETVLDLYEIPDNGPTRRFGSVVCPWGGMVQDFVATERHLVFVLAPGKLSMLRALFSVGELENWFKWDPREGCEIVVVPLDNPEGQKRFRADPFWVWHFSNAFERGSEIVIDYCRYPDFDSLGAIGGKVKAAPPKLHRAVVDPQRGSFRSEECWSKSCEFPRVEPQFEGARHPHSWLLAGEEGGVTGIARVGLGVGLGNSAPDISFWGAEAHVKASEPVPVSRKGEGKALAPWVLSLCHDDKKDRSFLAVLDGEALEAGPLAKVWFDQTIPTTFHGDWEPLAAV